MIGVFVHSLQPRTRSLWPHILFEVWTLCEGRFDLGESTLLVPDMWGTCVSSFCVSRSSRIKSGLRLESLSFHESTSMSIDDEEFDCHWRT